MAINAITVDKNGGISVASFREIRDSLEADYRAIFDEEGKKINLNPSSPDGMILDLFAFAYSALAEHLQFVVQGMNPATASGIFLDYLASITVGGRNPDESDEELRERIRSASHYGYATFDGMLTYLKDKIAAGVSMKANDEDRETDGIPAHSFVVYVPENAMATDDEIAQYIWDCKPAGIKAYGDASGKATDIGEMMHVVRFSRIEHVPFLARIAITEYDEEELPDDYADRIRSAVASWAEKEYTSGKDIIPQRISVPVYGVTGIESVEVEVSVDGGGNWQKTRQPIATGSYAFLPADNISVAMG